MAVLAAAQLLDELMGRHRNTNPNEKIKKPNWEDLEVSSIKNVSIITYFGRASVAQYNFGT